MHHVPRPQSELIRPCASDIRPAGAAFLRKLPDGITVCLLLLALLSSKRTHSDGITMCLLMLALLSNMRTHSDGITVCLLLLALLSSASCT